MICPNCENKIASTDNYCSKCGQANEKTILSFKEFISDFLGDYFTFDSKIFQSIKPLLVKPGFLTSEYLKGRRQTYIPPLRLYIFISILFFLIFDFSSQPLDPGSEGDRFQQVLNTIDSPTYYSRLFFLFMPLFALILSALYSRQKRYYSEHFIFSLHFHAFAFVWFAIYFAASAQLGHSWINTYLIFFFLFVAVIYLWVAMRRVYRQSILKTSSKILLLGFIYILTVSMTTITMALIIYKLKS